MKGQILVPDLRISPDIRYLYFPDQLIIIKRRLQVWPGIPYDIILPEDFSFHQFAEQFDEAIANGGNEKYILGKTISDTEGNNANFFRTCELNRRNAIKGIERLAKELWPN